MCLFLRAWWGQFGSVHKGHGFVNGCVSGWFDACLSATGNALSQPLISQHDRHVCWWTVDECAVSCPLLTQFLFSPHLFPSIYHIALIFLSFSHGSLSNPSILPFYSISYHTICSCPPSLFCCPLVAAACGWSSFCVHLYLGSEILHCFNWTCRGHPLDHVQCIWPCLLWADPFPTSPFSTCPRDPVTPKSRCVPGDPRRKTGIEHGEEEAPLSRDHETDTTHSAGQRLGGA